MDINVNVAEKLRFLLSSVLKLLGQENKTQF